MRHALIGTTATLATLAALTACGTDADPEAAPTTATHAAVHCSAESVPTPKLPAGLPQPVAATWQEIVDAAAACDFDALEAIATDQTTFSYGGKGFEVVRDAESKGEGGLATLLTVMSLGHAAYDETGGPSYVAWPAAAGGDFRDLTAAQKDELSALYSADEIAGFAHYGQYVGWRVGIRDDGTWAYFVSGD